MIGENTKIMIKNVFSIIECKIIVYYMSERDEDHSSLYLINKKLADLNRVIAIVEFNRISLIYGINTIKERYNDELTNIFNDHANIMQNILDELQNTRNNAENEIKDHYNDTFEQLLQQLYSIQVSMKSDLLSNITNINSEIGRIAEFINKYNSEFENEIRNLNKFGQEGINNMIKNAQEKIKEELSSHDNESKTKYNSLIENNKQHFKALDATFQKAVIDLKKKFFLSSKDQSFLNYIELYRSNSIRFFSFLDEKKNNIYKCEKDHKNFLSNCKMQIKAAIDEILYLEKRFQDEIQEASRNNKVEFSKFADFLSQIHDIQNSEQDRLNDKLKKLKDVWNQEKETLQNEFEKREKIINSNSELSYEQIHELKNQFKTDYIDLQQKYEKEEEEIKQKLNSLVFIPDKDPDDYSFRLKELRKMHSNEINFFTNQYQSELLYLNNEFTETKNKFQSLIDLISQKDQIKENFQIELKKIDDENDSFIIDFKNDLVNEQIAEKNKLEEENSAFISELDLKIKDCNEENRQKKFNRISELENQRLSLMTNIKHEFKTDKGIDNFISKYYEEYSKLNSQFETFDETLSESNLAKDDIEREREKLNEKEREILDEKNGILKKWQSEINLENDNHQKNLISNRISSDDEIRNKLNDELTNIRLNYMKLFNEKDNLLNELQIEMNELQKFKIDLETPELDEKIKNLRENLEKIKIECEKKIKSEEEAGRGQIYSPLLLQIQEQQNKNFQNLEIEKRKIEIEISDLAKRVNEDRSHLNKVIYEGNKSLNREMLAFQLKEQKMKNDHVKNVDDVTNLIIEVKKELDEILNRNIDDEISQDDKKFLIVQNAAISKNKKEIDKLLDDKKAVEKQLNLELKKLKTRYQEIRSLYNSKEARPEEQRVINRLEGILEVQSQSLTSSLKDMMSYRTHLQNQEEYYNTRFGVAPKIGVAMLKHRSSSQLAKSLPPL